jgi:hypothetical protein
MATINKDDFDGLANLTTASREAGKTLASILQDVADDFEKLRGEWSGFLTKLDTDFVAQNIAVTSSQLDEDYSSTHDVASGDILTKKGRV